MSNTTLAGAEKVISWIKDNGGFWDSSVLELRTSPLGGVGVFAKSDLDPEEEQKVLLRLYKGSLLSSQKSYIANLITDEGIEGALALVITFIYEKHRLEESPWKDYIETIQYLDDSKKPILPPALWTKKQKALLDGTELEMMGALDEAENQDAFERACTFAISQYEASAGGITIPYELDIIGKEDQEVKTRYEHFIAISHAVASRDFEIDEYHQVALCPGADLFNHEVENNVRFESFFDVCEFCGAIACDHVQEDGEEMEIDENDEHEHEHEHGHDDEHDDEHSEDESHSEEDQEDHDEEVSDGEEEEPEFDGTVEEFIEHIEAQFAEEKAQDEEEQKLEEESYPGPKITMFDENKPIHPDDCCDIVLQKKVSAGDEIFNTYGDFSNSILLSKYGFVIPGNTNDTVSLGIQILRLKKKKQYAKHFEWWETDGYEMMREFFKQLLHNHEEHDDDHEHGDGCEDGCCGGEGEDEDEDVPSWSMEMALLHDGEPTPLTFALLRLLTLSAPELKKFLQKKTKINADILTKPNKDTFKLLQDVVTARESAYAEVDFKKLAKKGGERERLASFLVLGELEIISKTKKLIKKNI